MSNYSIIESGISIPAGVYTTPNPDFVGPVTGLTATATTANIEQNIVRSILVSWTPPTVGYPTSYRILWRRQYGNYTEVPNIQTTTYEIPNAIDGLYEILVYAVNAIHNASLPTSVTYTLVTTGGGSTSLVAPTGLQLIGGGTVSTVPDYNIQWTNPSANNNTASVLKDFYITISNGSTIVKVDTINAVAPGTIAQYAYTNVENALNNSNIPLRSIVVTVQARDTLNNLSAAATNTFTNPAPSVPSTITFNPGFENITLTTSDGSTPLDFVGMVVWGSTTAGFTPTQSNRIFQGPGKVTYLSAPTSTQFYYRVAWFDSLSDQGLNVSGELTSTTLTSSNTNEYMIDGVTWTPNSPGANQVAWTACTAIKTQGAGLGSSWSVTAGGATWTSGILYIYYTQGGTTFSSTTSLPTALASATNVIVATYRGGTNLQIGDGKAFTDGSFIIAGTVGASQLVTGTAVITQSAQIGNNLIVGGQIQSNAITSAHIAANTIVAGDIAANTITGTQIAANTITATNLSVTSLSAVSANLGSITSGTITLGASSNIKGGQTAYNTGIGFFLGNDAGTYRFSIGNPAGNNMRWDGSAFSATGLLADVRPYAAGSVPIAATAELNGFSNSATSTTYVVWLGVTVVRTGVITVDFRLTIAGGLGGIQYGRIYVNGVGVGTERSQSGAGTTTFTENITISSANSTVEIWTRWGGSGNSGYCHSMLIKNAFAISEVMYLDNN